MPIRTKLVVPIFLMCDKTALRESHRGYCPICGKPTAWRRKLCWECIAAGRERAGNREIAG